MRRGTRLLLGVVAAALLSSGSGAQAGPGAALDVGRIDVTQKLEPGGSYRLPRFGVTNPGTERAAYRMTVSYLEGQRRKRPPEDWFRFSPSRVTLRAGASKPVSVRLDLPTGADAGDYEALVGPRLELPGDGAEVAVGAAATVTFTVTPANLLQAWWNRLKTQLSDWAPWWYVGAGLAVFGLAGWQLGRRFTLSVSRRTA